MNTMRKMRNFEYKLRGEGKKEVSTEARRDVGKVGRLLIGSAPLLLDLICEASVTLQANVKI